MDEVEGLFHWRSVVVHGGFHAIPREGPEWQEAVRTKGQQLLRTFLPETFTPGDPVPHRTVLFRVALQEVSGRKATPGDPAGEP